MINIVEYYPQFLLNNRRTDDTSQLVICCVSRKGYRKCPGTITRRLWRRSSAPEASSAAPPPAPCRPRVRFRPPTAPPSPITPRPARSAGRRASTPPGRPPRPENNRRDCAIASSIDDQSAASRHQTMGRPPQGRGSRRGAERQAHPRGSLPPLQPLGGG